MVDNHSHFEDFPIGWVCKLYWNHEGPCVFEPQWWKRILLSLKK